MVELNGPARPTIEIGLGLFVEKKGRNEIRVPVERAKKGAGRVGVGLAKWSDPVTEYYSVPMVLYNILLYIYSPCITSSRR
jgi:hypothetical protein